MPSRKQSILAGRPAINPAITFAAKMPQKQGGAKMQHDASRLYVVH